MGLLNRFRALLGTAGVEWRCTACGEIHASNPSECSNCGHTVLRQHRD